MANANLESNCPHCNQDVKAVAMVDCLRVLGYKIEKPEEANPKKGQFIDATIGDDFETIKIKR